MKNLIVNLNGDDRKVLQEQIRVSHEFINDAEKKLRLMTIHGRNYQTCENPQKSYQKDRDELNNHLKSLDDIKNYLVECFNNVS